MSEIAELERLWVCYCGQVGPWSWTFPHWDCQGGRPLTDAERDRAGNVRASA